MKDLTMTQQKLVMKISKMSFNELLKRLPIQNSKDPMNTNWGNELSLANPYNPLVCFIVYLYTMEFGDPPLYYELNRAARERDYSLLKSLGPFAQALSKISASSEKYRNEWDKIPNGEQMLFQEGGQMYNLHGCFLLWRGVTMLPE